MWEIWRQKGLIALGKQGSEELSAMVMHQTKTQVTSKWTALHPDPSGPLCPCSTAVVKNMPTQVLH